MSVGPSERSSPGRVGAGARVATVDSAAQIRAAVDRFRSCFA